MTLSTTKRKPFKKIVEAFALYATYMKSPMFFLSRNQVYIREKQNLSYMIYKTTNWNFFSLLFFQVQVTLFLFEAIPPCSFLSYLNHTKQIKKTVMHVLLGMISRPETNQKSQWRIAQSKRIALYKRKSFR